MAAEFVKARRKDTSIAEAKLKLAQGNYFGTMLVKMGKQTVWFPVLLTQRLTLFCQLYN